MIDFQRLFLCSSICIWYTFICSCSWQVNLISKHLSMVHHMILYTFTHLNQKNIYDCLIASQLFLEARDVISFSLCTCAYTCRQNKKGNIMKFKIQISGAVYTLIQSRLISSCYPCMDSCIEMTVCWLSWSRLVFCHSLWRHSYNLQYCFLYVNYKKDKICCLFCSLPSLYTIHVDT